MSPGVRRAVSGMAGAAAMIAAITIVTRLVGFGRWFAQSNALGGTATGTAYASANTLPNLIFEVVAGGALAGAVVPLLAGPLARHLRPDVDRIASALLTWALAVLLPTAVLLAVFARPLVQVLGITPEIGDAPAQTQATIDLAAHLIVIFAPQVVLYGIGVVLTGILQAQRRFVWPAAAPLVSSIAVITSYFVFKAIAGADRTDPAALSTEAVAWLGWGTTLGVAAMSLPLLVPVARSGVRLRPTFRFPAGVGLRARHLALAGIGALLAQQAAALVTLRLANTSGGIGTFNIFQYAQAVYFLPYAVLAVPLATSAFPRLAQHAATGDLTRYGRLVAVSTRAVLLVSAAGAAALIAASPAVAQIFATIDASEDPTGLAAMSPTLAILAPGLLGYGLIFQHSRVLFALERGRAAVTAVAIGWLAVIAASVAAVQIIAPDGPDRSGTLLGLAAGNTIGMTVAGIALVVAVRRCAGVLALAGTARTLVIAVAGGVVGAVGGRWVVDVVLGLLEDTIGAALFAGLGAAAVSTVVVLAVTWLVDRSTITGALSADRALPRPPVVRGGSTGGEA